MSLQRTTCCGRCYFQRQCYVDGTATPDVIQFSATPGDPTTRFGVSAPQGITLTTTSITVTLNSVDVWRAPTCDRTNTEWNITVEMDYSATTDYPGGFQTNCRCDDNGTYVDIPTWTGTASWTGTMVYTCLDDDTVTPGTINWENQTAPRYNLNDDIDYSSCAGTIDPPNPAITMDLHFSNAPYSWNPGATDCTSLKTKYFDAVFQFQLQQNGGCTTTTYGTPAELTVRFGWS